MGFNHPRTPPLAHSFTGRLRSRLYIHDTHVLTYYHILLGYINKHSPQNNQTFFPCLYRRFLKQSIIKQFFLRLPSFAFLLPYILAIILSTACNDFQFIQISPLHKEKKLVFFIGAFLPCFFRHAASEKFVVTFKILCSEIQFFLSKRVTFFHKHP